MLQRLDRQGRTDRALGRSVVAGPARRPCGNGSSAAWSSVKRTHGATPVVP